MNKTYEAPEAEVIEMVNNTAVLMLTGGAGGNAGDSGDQ
jgi:hypothetical protein